MNHHLINEIAAIVEGVCQSDNNRFGPDIWQNHILEVVKYSDVFASLVAADAEVVILAALLHDFAGIYHYKYYRIHHIQSAKAAEVLLKERQYPLKKRLLVEAAITSHRASVKLPYQSIEAEVLANADAMAHIVKFDSLLQYAQNYRGLTPPQSYQFVAAKLERSWQKMSQPFKKLADNKYRLATGQLNVNVAC